MEEGEDIEMDISIEAAMVCTPEFESPVNDLTRNFGDHRY